MQIDRQTFVRMALALFIVVACCLAVLALLNRISDGQNFHFSLTYIDVICILFIQSLILLLAGVNWRFVQSAIGLPLPRFSLSLFEVGAMYLGKYVPGKVWGVAVRSLVMKERGVDYSDSIKASGNELIAQLLVGFGFGSLVFVSANLSISQNIAVFVATTVLIAIAFYLSVRYGSLVIDWFSKRTIKKDIGVSVEVLDLKASFIVVVNYAFQWVLIGAIFALFYSMINAGTNLTANEFFILCYAAAAAASVGFVAVFSPGGIGVREGVFVLLAGPHIGVEVALAVSVVARIWNVQFDLFAAGVSSLGLRMGRS